MRKREKGMFRFECPECGITLSAPDSTSWKPARCKACGARFIVPESPKAAFSRLAPDAQTDLLTIGAFHVEALSRLGELRFSAWLNKMVNEFKALNMAVADWPDGGDLWRRIKAGEGVAANLPAEMRAKMRSGDVVDRTWRYRVAIEAERAAAKALAAKPAETVKRTIAAPTDGRMNAEAGQAPLPLDRGRWVPLALALGVLATSVMTGLIEVYREHALLEGSQFVLLPEPVLSALLGTAAALGGGALAVYAATHIVPSHRRLAAGVIAGALGFASVLGVVALVIGRNWWSIPAVVGVAVGAMWCVFGQTYQDR